MAEPLPLQSPKIIAKFGRIPLAICGSIDASLTALEQILTDLSWARYIESRTTLGTELIRPQ